MKSHNFLLLAFVSLFLLNCNNNSTESTSITNNDSISSRVSDNMHDSAIAEPPLGDNTENAVDWPGTYKGVLPCADCEGIETLLTLKADKSYSLNTTYLGRSNKVKEEKGNFSWNRAGNTITLTSAATPNQYFVGENNIWKLDKDGNKINGNLADNYRLTKQTLNTEQVKTKTSKADTARKVATLTETFWKLVEINGQPIPAYKGTREIHIILKNQDKRVQGFAGCNTIMGSYELKGETFIRFQKIASTLMACPDMSTEEALKKVLEMTDNYSISGNHLSLNKARMAPLARFEAVLVK